MPAKKKTTSRARGAAAASRMASRRRRLADSAWWADDFGDWFDDFALDPFRLAPNDATPHLRNARTEFLKALRSVLNRWIERSERPPGRASPSRSAGSAKRSAKRSTKVPSRVQARAGAQRVRVR